ncbi:MAG: PLP-dependent aminotransferase family protein [Pseudomonadota bacterium]
MPKARLLLDWLTLDEAAALPLYRQLYDQLRAAMLNGRLPTGSLLPSSRMLARELKVSRNTIVNAYDQLIAEGYLETAEGSATSVADLSPTSDGDSRQSRQIDVNATPSLSKRGIEIQRALEEWPHFPEAVAFTPGVPAFDQFPVKKWVRLLTLQAQRVRSEMASSHAHVGGYGPLREALASYLRTSRMVTCEADQVFVVSSARAGLDLVCRLLLDPGTSCLMEDPGYVSAKDVFRAADLRISPVPVDKDGLCIQQAEEIDPAARMAFVTPSHQYPMGVSLSAPRRQQLIEWADRRNAWIVEDDYDSEFRFDSRPLATLQGLDGGHRVIYIGTFAKVLFPTLRTAYVVVPRPLIPVFGEAVYNGGQEPPLHIQAALAEFINDGHFFTHIRRMRQVYKRRQASFVDSLKRHVGNRIPVERPPGGMQLVLNLPDEVPEAAASAAAAAHGLHARPLGIYSLAGTAPNALFLGFAAVPDQRIDPATKTLASAIFNL